MIKSGFNMASVRMLLASRAVCGKHITKGMNSPYWRMTPVASVANLKPPTEFPDLIFPERRKLRILPKVPMGDGQTKPQRMPKRLIDMRGPELIHNKLMYKMYGIRALQGGNMKHAHNEMVRMSIFKKLDEKRMFAVWRIDAPWKPIVKRGAGTRMGGGKGQIDQYVTPVKAGRIIIEMAGRVEYEEAQPILTRIAEKLPFKAEFISQEILEAEQEKERQMEEENLNPFTFKHCLDSNLLGSHKWASKYDFLWYGKYH